MSTTCEKTVLVEQKVEDLWGLLLDLRRASFRVRNVASDARGTYIYLELEEEKDPTPIVEAWVGKAAPKPSLILRDIRKKELEKVEEEEEARRLEQLEAERLLDEAHTAPPTEADVLPLATTSSEKIGFLKKIFRKFF